MLIAREDGVWGYERVQNEVARSLSISRKDALFIANESRVIAERLGKACHIMWFVGCIDGAGQPFSMPWYWNLAHYAEPNEDRSRHVSFSVTGRASLGQLEHAEVESSRYVIVLRPDHPALFRDTDFINEVADVSRARGIPVVLEGSTLAHAYYQLIDRGCTVIARGEKEHSRIRKSTPFGKIVRNKIPDRIAARQELGASIEIPENMREAFLIGKILEEALEVRDSPSPEERTIELADVLEIVRALAQLAGVSLADVITAADKKRDKLGGFDHGQLLLQTGIGAPGRKNLVVNSSSAQVLSHSIAPDIGEIPFTFFGFAELDAPRSIPFTAYGISLELTLKSDRIVLRIVPVPAQLELPLSLEIEGDGA
jgi:predicted house-cleaning noncanonical NTP pyrophosphatase (MazG superfamily)